jgi:uncharacterized protein with HEPN domain
MSPSQVEFLRHILDECNYLIKESQDNSFENFVQDERLSRAVCRSLEIIGEASNKIDQSLKDRYPFVTWREMSGIRNRIIHNYFGIDYDIVWDTVVTDIPQLKEWVEMIIEQEK